MTNLAPPTPRAPRISAADLARIELRTELERQLWRYGPPAWTAGLTRKEVVEQLRAMAPAPTERSVTP